eukprot:scaffold15210_cov157-Isochrysis_galbana.AAC.1
MAALCLEMLPCAAMCCGCSTSFFLCLCSAAPPARRLPLGLRESGPGPWAGAPTPWAPPPRSADRSSSSARTRRCPAFRTASRQTRRAAPAPAPRSPTARRRLGWS